MVPRKIALFILSAAIFLFCIARLYYGLTDDFSLQNISYPEATAGLYPSPSPSNRDKEKLFTILNQKFYYLGKGAQSYVFASSDGQFVLKFFKFKHLKPNWLMYLLPPVSPFKEWKARYLARKKRKFMSVFRGYELAYTKDKEEAGLVYLQLAPHQGWGITTILVDKIGFEKPIDAGAYVFLIQKRGEPLRKHLDGILKQGDLEKARERIQALLEMYVKEYKKGLYDLDHGLMQNTGFIGDQPFHLDAGKLTEEPEMQNPLVYKQDLEWVIWKIREWLVKHHPATIAYFNPFLAAQYQYWTGEELPLPPANEAAWKLKSRMRYTMGY